MNNIMVSICCTAYNHENYIADALESFLMQKTNFDFEILIHDDASTDRTAEIIKKYEERYPNIIKPIYQTENQYSKGVKVGQLNRERANGKYIALCEGDDYWIDTHKLQKQIDYMESNSECSLCVHAGEKVSIKKKHRGLVRPDISNKIYTTDDVILGGGGMFVTNSMFFPTILLKDIPDFYFNCSIGDYPLTIYLSLKGYVFYIDEIMSAYRIGVEGSWTNRMKGNIQKNIEHIKMIENMLNKVDEYSNYVHTDAIKEHILKNRFNLMIEQGKFKKLKKGKYKEVYLNLTIKSQLKIFLKQYFPDSTDFLVSIKRKLYK